MKICSVEFTLCACVCLLVSNAKKCYQKALQLNPVNARAAVSLGDCYMADGDEVNNVLL